VAHPGTLADVLVALAAVLLRLNNRAVLNDVFEYIVVLASAELAFQLALGGTVEDTVVAVLVRHEDLPAADDGCQGDGLVILPVADSLSRVDEDDEVVALALVVDLALGFVSARHCGWVLCGF